MWEKESNILLGKKVLIVDDCNPLNEVISKFCAKWGARPVLARNAEEMVQKSREEKPDLILLHLNTAGMENFHQWKDVKSAGGNAHVPILLTSSDHFELKNAVFKEPKLFDDYLPKPFHINQLYEKAVRLINKSNQY